LSLTAHQTAPFQSIDVIPNGIDANIFYAPILPKKPGRSFRMICVSRLIKRKGIEHILQAIYELGDDNLRLLIVGSGNYEQHLKKRCSELGLNRTVAFYGYCNHNRLSRLFSESDVFILIPRSEAFGNVFAEAMVSGLPIIGSTLGGIPDLISEENGILVEPGNVGKIKQAIVTMKDSSNLRRIMGEANRNKILTHYNWKRIAKKYVEVYKSAVDS
jgi:glycosyltransferase involved in cell wall biosynthesis